MIIDTNVINLAGFSIVAFFFIALITEVFLRKKKIMCIENHILKALIFATLSTLLFEIASILLYKQDINNIYYRVSTLLCETCEIIDMSIIVLYYIVLIKKPGNTYIELEKDPNKVTYKGYINKVLLADALLAIINIVLFFIVPNQEDGVVIYILNENVKITFSIVCMIISILLLIIINITSNIKNKLKYFFPIYIFIIIAILGLVYNTYINNIYILDSIIALLVTIIFFTFGNPDIGLMEEISLAKETADRSNKAKTDFLNSMSHEIRTPLNAIVGFSDSLIEEQMSEENHEIVSLIQTSATNLLEIVNGILDISKMDAKKLELTEQEYIINKIVNNITSNARTMIGSKKIDLKVRVSESVPQLLYGDSIKLKSIINNLITNAIKATSEGTIEFSIDAIIENDNCRLIGYIEDTGVGMSDEYLNKILNISTENNDGSSLGVAVTVKLINLMGGNIIAKSKKDLGTIFIFALNQKVLAETSNKVENLYEEKIEMFDLNSKKVLVVDDNNVNLKVSKRLLKEYKIEADTALSGKECLEKLLSGQKYDIIMMDDYMPEMDGKQTLDALKTQIKDFTTPVIALTANNEADSKTKYQSIGFNDFLAKPITKEELNEILKKFLIKN